MSAGDDRHVTPIPLHTNIDHIPRSKGRTLFRSPLLRAEGPVLIDVAEGRGCTSLSRKQLLATTTEPALRTDDLTVALELSEGHHEQFPRAFARMSPHEVGSHVVGGSEHRPQSEGATGSEIGDLLVANPRAPEHHGVADRVDS